jgi:hypothetical protein
MNHATSLWFGAFRTPTGWRRMLSPRVWTCVGALAIPLWATWPALALWSFELLLVGGAIIVTAGILSRGDSSAPR